MCSLSKVRIQCPYFGLLETNDEHCKHVSTHTVSSRKPCPKSSHVVPIHKATTCYYANIQIDLIILVQISNNSSAKCENALGPSDNAWKRLKRTSNAFAFLPNKQNADTHRQPAKLQINNHQKRKKYIGTSTKHICIHQTCAMTDALTYRDIIC